MTPKSKRPLMPLTPPSQRVPNVSVVESDHEFFERFSSSAPPPPVADNQSASETAEEAGSLVPEPAESHVAVTKSAKRVSQRSGRRAGRAKRAR